MERSDLEQWRPKDVARLLALVETQRRYYQEIVAGLPVGVLVLSSDYSVILANTAARRIFEVENRETLQRKLDMLLPAWVLDRTREVLKSGVPQTNLMLDTGNRRLRMNISAIRNWDDDAAVEALLTIEDLSGIVSADSAQVPVPTRGVEAISASMLLDNVDAAIWAIDSRTMQFVFVNRAAGKLLGFPANQWIDRASFWTERVHAADRDWVTESYQRAMERAETHSCEFRALTSDGRVVWLREMARVLADSAGRPSYVIGISVDVTERRLLEEELVQSERIDAIGKLASRMAHDLNNMLMILTGYGEELLNNVPANSPLRNDVQEILTATERITGLTSHLLAFTRKQASPTENVALDTVLAAVSQKFGLPLGPPSRTQVKANAAHLEQILTAIIERARPLLPKGDKIAMETSHLEIGEDFRRVNAPLRRGNYVAIAITSTAPAPERGSKPGWLESFLPGKDAADELAMALSQSYGIVRQWGGDLQLAEGSLVRILLETPGAQPESPPHPNAVTVLVVEDEPGIRALVVKILRRQNFEVLEAASGQEALAICREHTAPIQLLITDMMMPQMTGRELVDRLTGQGRDMKVLFISGYTDDATVYSGDLPAGRAFLQKPFTLGALLEKVKQVLAS